MRYGLRGQLTLNVGFAMGFFTLLFGLFSMFYSQQRFHQNQERYLNIASGLLDQFVFTHLQPIANRPRSKSPYRFLLEKSEENELGKAFASLRRSPWIQARAAVIITGDGKVWMQFGRVPSKVVKKLRVWLHAHQKRIWDKVVLPDGGVVWDRYRSFSTNRKEIGGMWVRWDPAEMGKEFFSYQGVLLVYLVLLCILVLLLLWAFFERRLIRPLERLGDAIRSLSSGGKSGALEKEIVRGDEIGALARTFLEVERILSKQTFEREKSIQALKKVNQALERAQLELVEREKMSTVGHLAAGLAHEVGNPLSAIIGYSDLLADSREFGDLQKDLLKRISKETKRIDRIIRELLDYARPAPDSEPGIPNKAIEESVELLRLQKRFRDMEVSLDVDEALPYVRLSTARLIQVLINFLLNAADACGQQGKIHIEASFLEDEEEVCIVLADDGPGIPEEIRDQLFEPFFTTKEPGKGVGLGLALCHSLVLGSGGRIEIEIEVEEGATFLIFLPVFTMGEPLA